jgi:hypothetical protein
VQINGSDIENQVSRLLVQYLNERPEFAAWYWQKVSAQRRPLPAFTVGHAEFSPRRQHTTGQTDFGLTTTTSRSTILTENKVIHHLDKDQRDRYRRERDGLISDGWATAIALTAPARYLQAVSNATDDFDASVSYEAINQFLGGDPLITKAILRCEQGYLAQGIPAVTSNFEGYAQLVRVAFPKLCLLTKAGTNPTQSRTTQFDSGFAIQHPTGVPYVWLLHQWQQGTVKLLFKDWAAYRAQLTPIMSGDVATAGYAIDPGTPTVKSLGFMRRTPVVNNHAPFKQNEEAFIEGLRAVHEIKDWYLTHLEIVAAWVSRVAHRKPDHV